LLALSYTVNKKTIYPWLLFIVIVALSAIVIRNTPDKQAEYSSVAWFLAVIVALWAGNVTLTQLLDIRLTWLRYGYIRFFLQLIIGVLFTLIAINGIYFLFKYLVTVSPPTRQQLIVMNVYGAGIFIPVYSIYFSLYFLRHWRSSELAAERYQKESVRSQLESLKNHLDPHFLFNNLNILSALIDQDKNKSKEFLEHFVEVYRSTLRSKSDDLITLEEELSLIESYMFLIKTRFGDNIQFTIAIDHLLKKKFLPPLTLQMLIENAIKHNRISEKRPLQINVATDIASHYVIVRNSLYPKEETGETTGSGQNAIRDRYRYFTERVVNVEQSDDAYLVKVPLLDIQKL
jgi:sensor histidine kinase YesM